MAIHGWAPGTFTIQKTELSAKFQALKRKIPWGGRGAGAWYGQECSFLFHVALLKGNDLHLQNASCGAASTAQPKN